MPKTLQPAGLGRRLVALVVDWALASFVSAGFFGYDPMATLGVFAVMTWVLVGTLGATIGHVAVGIAVRRVADGGLPGLVKALVRTVALCLVLPAAVTSDGRGFHDVWAGTVITRLR